MNITKLGSKFSETRIDNEIVLMNIDTGSFYALKSTSLAIWDAIDIYKTRAATIEALMSKFSVTPTRCEADVDAFLAEIEKAGFVTLG